MQQVIAGDFPSPVKPHSQQGAFVATTTGVKLLHHRLLRGPVDYFDTCMHEPILAGKVRRSEFPWAGSRDAQVRASENLACSGNLLPARRLHTLHILAWMSTAQIL